jgi:hypothetical protein
MLGLGTRRAVADQALHRGTDVQDIAGCKQQRHVPIRHVSYRYGRAPNPAPIGLTK